MVVVEQRTENPRVGGSKTRAPLQTAPTEIVRAILEIVPLGTNFLRVHTKYMTALSCECPLSRLVLLFGSYPPGIYLSCQWAKISGIQKMGMKTFQGGAHLL